MARLTHTCDQLHQLQHTIYGKQIIVAQSK